MSPDQQRPAAPTLLWIGTDAPCSLDLGLSWHELYENKTLADHLDRSVELLRGRGQDWSIEGDRLMLRGTRVDPDHLTSAQTVVFNHKHLPDEELAHLADIEAWLRTRAPHLRMVNPLAASPLFMSKQAFAEGMAALPRAGKLIPGFRVLDSVNDVRDAVDALGLPLVLKADDLSGGKGVVLANTLAEAQRLFTGLRMGQQNLGTEGRLKRVRTMLRRVLGRDHGYARRTVDGGCHPVLAMAFVDTFHADLDLNLNAALYYWGDRLSFANPRPARRAWNIHGATVEYSDVIGTERFRRTVELMYAALDVHREELAELRTALPGWAVRLDALLAPDGRLYVAEPELKWGPGSITRDRGLASLDAAGFGLARLRREGVLHEVDVMDLVRGARVDA